VTRKLLPRQRWPELQRGRASRFDAYTGAPPAGSAYRLRTALATFGLVFSGVTAGLFAAHGWPVPAGLLCLVGLTAVIDLMVIGVRSQRQRRARRRPTAMEPGAVRRSRDRSGTGSYLP
jgi:hypothetical protein